MGAAGVGSQGRLRGRSADGVSPCAYPLHPVKFTQEVWFSGSGVNKGFEAEE